MGNIQFRKCNLKVQSAKKRCKVQKCKSAKCNEIILKIKYKFYYFISKMNIILGRVQRLDALKVQSANESATN